MNRLLWRALATGLLITTVPFQVNASEYKGNGMAAIPATANAENIVKATYEVSLDPLLELKWDKRDEYKGEYLVGVKGKVSKNCIIKVEPDDEFYLTCNGKKEKGKVVQGKRCWGSFVGQDKDMLILKEDSYTYTDGAAYATVKGNGYYKGGIIFRFRVLKES